MGSRNHLLPTVAEDEPVALDADLGESWFGKRARSPNLVENAWVHSPLPTSARPRTGSTTRTFGSRISLSSINRSDDLGSMALSDQRWSLQRMKIGLGNKGSTHRMKARTNRNNKKRDINLSFIRTHFKRKECIKYGRDHGDEGEICYCHRPKEDHLTVQQHLGVKEITQKSQKKGGGLNGFFDKFTVPNFLHGNDNEIQDTNPLVTLNMVTSPIPTNVVSIPEDLERRKSWSDKLDMADGITRRGSRDRRTSGDNIFSQKDVTEVPASMMMIPASNPSTTEWTEESCIKELPTNAYGRIYFSNENAGTSKPSKYIRLSNSSNASDIVTLLTDYWNMAEPAFPQLVLSVVGGAKNFKLDGKKKDIFATGLIRAVKSTDAWLITSGTNVGVVKEVGDAVNKGQYLSKVKRKAVFGEEEEEERYSRGIRCIGVAPWGYVKDNHVLINPDANAFHDAKYKVDDKCLHRQPVSINGDHTHYIFVDTGYHESFVGSDKLRTQIEEAIQAPVPQGLGVPVVILALEGGISSLVKVSLALNSGIPAVVVSGTGRAADLIAYGISMTSQTRSGNYFLKKEQRKSLKHRVGTLMKEFGGHKKKIKHAMKLIIQCCYRANLVTIFDIDSGEGLDKYILLAILTGNTSSSRIDQLNLALLWNRPDIAENYIFPEMEAQPPGALEELMTSALLDEKIEFVQLLLLNGVVMTDYLTVQILRELYNEACVPNSHIMDIMHNFSNSERHYLADVHNMLQSLVKRHVDLLYISDTKLDFSNDTSKNYATFQDPYEELLLWAILTGRTDLGRLMWERCHHPLSAAVIVTVIFQSLWLSLGAKSTDLRQIYYEQKGVFEKLAIEFLSTCYKDDPVNALALVERRNLKWGNADCLELGFIARDLTFLSSPCCQFSADLTWRRGMVRAPGLAIPLAIYFPFIVWTGIFKFLRLGDDGGELTLFQKIVVFYRSPIAKFYTHAMSFLIFLSFYVYTVLFDLQYHMTSSEIVILCWIFTFIIGEINEIANEPSHTLFQNLKDYWLNGWNRFESMTHLLAILAFILRLFRSTFYWGRILYAANTWLFFTRILRYYHVNYQLGPKLIIFYRMTTEILIFMALLINFILGYGIASQALLNPAPSRGFNVTTLFDIGKTVFFLPYWQMYGELSLDAMQGEDKLICHSANSAAEDIYCENPSDYTWAVHIMLVFYLIIGNIMLLNLLIAIFTYVFDEVQEKSMEFWKFEMYRLIREYDLKPVLPPPFVVVGYAYQIIDKLIKKCCYKEKENYYAEFEDTLEALQIFEKEAINNYLTMIKEGQTNSTDHLVKKTAEKVDKVVKYLEREEDKKELQDYLEWSIEDESENKVDTKPGFNEGKGYAESNWVNHELVVEDESDSSEEEDTVQKQTLSDEDIDKEIKHLKPSSSISMRSSKRSTGTAIMGRGRSAVNLTNTLSVLQRQSSILEQQNQNMQNMMQTLVTRLDHLETNKSSKGNDTVSDIRSLFTEP